MPSIHADGKKQVSVWLDEEQRARLEEVVRAGKDSCMSDFLKRKIEEEYKKIMKESETKNEN